MSRGTTRPMETLPGTCQRTNLILGNGSLIHRLLIQRLQLTDTKLMTQPMQFLLNHLGMARNTETTNSIDLYYIQLPNYFTKV